MTHAIRRTVYHQYSNVNCFSSQSGAIVPAEDRALLKSLRLLYDPDANGGGATALADPPAAELAPVADGTPSPDDFAAFSNFVNDRMPEPPAEDAGAVADPAAKAAEEAAAAEAAKAKETADALAAEPKTYQVGSAQYDDVEDAIDAALRIASKFSPESARRLEDRLKGITDRDKALNLSISKSRELQAEHDRNAPPAKPAEEEPPAEPEADPEDAHYTPDTIKTFRENGAAAIKAALAEISDDPKIQGKLFEALNSLHQISHVSAKEQIIGLKKALRGEVSALKAELASLRSALPEPDAAGFLDAFHAETPRYAEFQAAYAEDFAAYAKAAKAAGWKPQTLASDKGRAYIAEKAAADTMRKILAGTLKPTRPNATGAQKSSEEQATPPAKKRPDSTPTRGGAPAPPALPTGPAADFANDPLAISLRGNDPAAKKKQAEDYFAGR